MGTSIIQSQNCCCNPPFYKSFSDLIPSPNSCPGRSRANRNSTSASNSRHRNSNSVKFRLPEPGNSPKNELVNSQVRILKRGETLDVNKENVASPDMVLGSMVRLGPDSKTVEKQIRVPVSGKDTGCPVFAGLGLEVAPPPSSVPVPGFLAKLVK